MNNYQKCYVIKSKGYKYSIKDLYINLKYRIGYKKGDKQTPLIKILKK